jgi:ketosteroid isomerase-like protein
MGDLAGLMAIFHADISFKLAGDQAALAVAGTTIGHSKVKEVLAQFIKDFDFWNREIISTVIDGDRAAVHSRVDIHFKPKDHKYQTEILDVFRFKDGKVIELVEFADTAQLKDLTSGG